MIPLFFFLVKYHYHPCKQPIIDPISVDEKGEPISYSFFFLCAVVVRKDGQATHEHFFSCYAASCCCGVLSCPIKSWEELTMNDF